MWYILVLVGCCIRRHRFCWFCYMQGCGIQRNRGRWREQVLKIALFFLIFLYFYLACTFSYLSWFFVSEMFAWFRRSGRPTYSGAWIDQVNWVPGMSRSLNFSTAYCHVMLSVKCSAFKLHFAAVEMWKSGLPFVIRISEGEKTIIWLEVLQYGGFCFSLWSFIKFCA